MIEALSQNESPHDDKVVLVDTRSQLMLSIDDKAALQISNEDGTIELDANQVLAVGNFLRATEGLWRS